MGETPRTSSPRRQQLIVALIVVVVAAVTLSSLAFTRSSPPTSRVGYSCAPVSSFSVAHRDLTAVVHARLDGYVAQFSTAVGIDEGAPSGGLPLKGTLLLTGPGRRWRLTSPQHTAAASLDQLCVAQFSSTGQPSILVEGYTGGAHCCEEPVLYQYSSDQDRYIRVIDTTASHGALSVKFDDNGGYQPKLVRGHVLLETADDSFAYTFGCYACTPMPLRLDAVHDGRLVDVTSNYPSLVRAQAQSLWRGLQTVLAQQRTGGTNVGAGPFGVLAAWVADECVLRRGSSAWSTVTSLQRAGDLSEASYYADTLRRGDFLTELNTFLLREDYCGEKSA